MIRSERQECEKHGQYFYGENVCPECYRRYERAQKLREIRRGRLADKVLMAVEVICGARAY